MLVTVNALAFNAYRVSQVLNKNMFRAATNLSLSQGPKFDFRKLINAFIMVFTTIENPENRLNKFNKSLT